MRHIKRHKVDPHFWLVFFRTERCARAHTVGIFVNDFTSAETVRGARGRACSCGPRRRKEVYLFSASTPASPAFKGRSSPNGKDPVRSARKQVLSVGGGAGGGQHTSAASFLDERRPSVRLRQALPSLFIQLLRRQIGADEGRTESGGLESLLPPSSLQPAGGSEATHTFPS